MNKLNMLMVALGVAVAGCSAGTDEAPKQNPAQEAAALEKQAEIQEAVGDKAGAARMREQAAALRAGTAAPAADQTAG